MRKREQSDLLILETPTLRQPRLIAAFGGWPDAGEVATGALRYLAAKLRAKKFARIEGDEFYNYTSLRPVTLVEQGTITTIRYPANDFLYWVNENATSDLIIFLGTEPHLRWRRYINLLLELMEAHQVGSAIAFGSFFDAIPHTKEVKVSGSASGEGFKERLLRAGVAMVDYQGPTSIHSAFSLACQERGIEAASLWAHCPLYVRAPANPKGCHALLSKLCALTDLDLNLEDLKGAADYLDSTLSKLLRQNKELSLYVRKLEEQYEGGAEAADDPAGESERIIREVEDFLRREQRGHGDE